MIRRISIIGHPIRLTDLMKGLYAFVRETDTGQFVRGLRAFSRLEYAFLLNSGIASFYIILKTLKKLSARTEVLLPDYTAASLVVAVLKAGLKPVLCDIRLSDFNMDAGDMFRKINRNTLCILGVHMFGIPWRDIAGLRDTIDKDIFLIEDCAQAFGARINGKPVGCFGDISFYSFNRGKNLPTYEGGCIVTASERLAAMIQEEMKRIKPLGTPESFLLFIKLCALYISFKPLFYGFLNFLIRRFKDNSVSWHIKAKGYAPFQAAVGGSLLWDSAKPFLIRAKNSKYLERELKNTPGIKLPEISDDIEPLFNRFPVVFEDEPRVDTAIDALRRQGIESSRLYHRPLHKVFDLGYEDKDLPNAAYFAARLLTLPIHPLVREPDIKKIAGAIKSCLAG